MSSAKKSSIYDYRDYKLYLKAWMENQPLSGRGTQTKVAKLLRCDVAYVSRVFGGNAHFSLEQAHALSEFLAHSNEESDFFLLLVSFGRAATVDLQGYYQNKINAEVKRKNVLKNRLEFKKTLAEVDQTTFYSSWYYLAVQLLVTMPTYQTKESLLKYLKISPRRLNQVLEFLLREGLVNEKMGNYSAGETRIHLANDSPLISKHHANWKLQALQSLEREKVDELHYSSVITANQKDIPEVRKVMIKAIEDIRAIVKASAQEDVMYCYSLDLFEV
jgi:uncharacterized protein (TIGR02147 family)